MSLNPGLGYLAIANVLRTLEKFSLENFQNKFGGKPALVVFFYLILFYARQNRHYEAWHYEKEEKDKKDIGKLFRHSPKKKAVC